MSSISTLVSDMTEAATNLLDILSPEQRQAITLSFRDDEERRRWYYTPTPRAGVSLLHMNPIQQGRVMRLLSIGMSEAGFNHAALIMGLENIVAYHANFPERTYGDLPGTRVRDPLNYFVAFFDEPGSDMWSWRIGGHHFSIHFTVHDGAISPTPAFYGAEPAKAPMPGGLWLRPLAAEEDLARQLLTSLKQDQLAKAVISPIAPTDIVQQNRPRIEDNALPPTGGTGPGGEARRKELGLTPEHDEMVRFSLQAKGLPATAMDASQQETLKRLVSTYFEHLAEPIVAQYTEQLTPGAIEAATFAWAGPPEPGAPHYYRIQADRMLIEYDCVQNGANHSHSVLRDPQGDFGEDILAHHYATEHR